MIQIARPSNTTAAQAREALAAAGVRANVARQRFSTRIVVLGNETMATLAIAALRTAGFVGAGNGDLSFGGTDGRFQIFAYRVAQCPWS